MVVKAHGTCISAVMVRNYQLMIILYSSRSVWETGSISLLLALKEGDKVWIMHYNAGLYIHWNFNLFLEKHKSNNKSFAFKVAFLFG